MVELRIKLINQCEREGENFWESNLKKWGILRTVLEVSWSGYYTTRLYITLIKYCEREARVGNFVIFQIEKNPDIQGFCF